MSDRQRTRLEEKWAAEAAQEPAAPAPPDQGESTGLAAEVADLKDKLLRSQAEMVNFRRRAERTRLERAEAARAEVLRELLPVVDDFERAVEADTASVDAYRQGVELILRTLLDTLERIGVSRLEPLGEAFDPNLHEAVERQETIDVEEGHVSEVFNPGYTLGDRLLRAAMVAVAMGPSESGDSDADATAGD